MNRHVTYTPRVIALLAALLAGPACLLGGVSVFTQAPDGADGGALQQRYAVCAGVQTVVTMPAASPLGAASLVGPELYSVEIRALGSLPGVTIPATVVPGVYSVQVDGASYAVIEVVASGAVCQAPVHDLPAVATQAELGAVRVSWSVVDTVAEWTLEASRDGQTTQVLATLEPSVRDYLHAPLPDGDERFYRVRARFVDAGIVSETVSPFVRGVSLPGRVRRLVAQASASSVTLSWQAAAGASSYRIERTSALASGEIGAAPFVSVGSTQAGNFVDTAAGTGRQWFYRVTSMSGERAGRRSGLVRANLPAVQRLAACVAGAALPSRGLLLLDGQAADVPHPTAELRFDGLGLALPPSDIALRHDTGELWITDGDTLRVWSAETLTPVWQRSLVPTRDGAALPPGQRGARLLYDPVAQQMLALGRNPALAGAVAARVVLPADSAGLAPVVDAAPLLLDSAAYALDPVRRELYAVTQTQPPEIAISALDTGLDTGALVATIGGPAARLGSVRAMVFDAARDELVVATATELLRFARGAVDERAAPTQALAVALDALALSDGAEPRVYGYTSGTGVVSRFEVLSSGAFVLTGAYSLPAATLGGGSLTDCRIAYEPHHARAVLVCRRGETGTMVLTPSEPWPSAQGPQVLGGRGVVGAAELHAQCGVGNGRLVTSNGDPDGLVVTFFTTNELTAPQWSNRAWTAFQFPVANTANVAAHAFFYDAATDEVVIGGSALWSGLDVHFVAFFDADDPGPTVTATRVMMRDHQEPGAPRTPMRVIATEDEVLLWKKAAGRVWVMGRFLSSPVPTLTAPTIDDVALTADVVGLAQAADKTRIYVLLPQQLRIYVRSGEAVAFLSAIDLAAGGSAITLAHDRSAGELFVGFDNGVVHVLDQAGTLRRTLRGPGLRLSEDYGLSVGAP